MLYIYLALGLLFFALVWRTGKYDDLPSRWYYPAPRSPAGTAARHHRDVEAE